jgi:hypothetical protein
VQFAASGICHAGIEVDEFCIFLYDKNARPIVCTDVNPVQDGGKHGKEEDLDQNTA